MLETSYSLLTSELGIPSSDRREVLLSFSCSLQCQELQKEIPFSNNPVATMEYLSVKRTSECLSGRSIISIDREQDLCFCKDSTMFLTR